MFANIFSMANVSYTGFLDVQMMTNCLGKNIWQMLTKNIFQMSNNIYQMLGSYIFAKY